MNQKTQKTCLSYKENPNCEKKFWCEPRHMHSRVLCPNCKRIEKQDRKTAKQREKNLEKRIELIKELEAELKTATNKKGIALLQKRIKIMQKWI